MQRLKSLEKCHKDKTKKNFPTASFKLFSTSKENKTKKKNVEARRSPNSQD